MLKSYAGKKHFDKTPEQLAERTIRELNIVTGRQNPSKKAFRR